VVCAVGNGRRLILTDLNERKWPSRLGEADKNGSWWTPMGLSNYRLTSEDYETNLCSSSSACVHDLMTAGAATWGTTGSIGAGAGNRQSTGRSQAPRGLLYAGKEPVGREGLL
jgi:hypothetical protein